MQRRRMFLVIALALLLSACGSATTSTHTPAASPTVTTTIPSHPQVFALAPRNPVLPHGSVSAWDSRFIDPGAMVYYNGKFHMFYNGITGFRRRSRSATPPQRTVSPGQR